MPESDEIRAALERRIEEVRNLEKKPDNEACTCEWVIRPLLESAGYAVHEVKPQDAGGHGIPDYTILPDTDWTWFLEAKAWSRSIENGADAVQALNYANAQGRRWVVLSNGRQWLLFDNHMTGVEAPQRLVARAELAAPDFLDFMLALSKPSTTGGKLEGYVTKSRVLDTLDQQLKDEKSEVVRQILTALRRLGIQGVQKSDVVEYFQAREARQKVREVEETQCSSGADAEPPPPPASERTKYTLAELWEVRDRLSGKTPPLNVVFPDHSSASLSIWADLAYQVVLWFAQRQKVPDLPFKGCPKSSRWFINREPFQPGGKKMSCPRTIEAQGRTLHIESFWTPAYTLVENLLALCNAVGEPPEGFVVTLAKPLDTK